MTKKINEKDGKGKLLLMPNQFQVMPLGDMMQEIMEEDLRRYCLENGLDPEEYKPVCSDFPKDK